MLIALLRRIRASRFVARERPLDSVMDIIFWWEARRPAFNLLVGVTGVITITAIVVLGVIGHQLYTPNEELMLLPDPPIFAVLGVIAYGIAANICFTGGWVVELLIRWAWPDESNPLATLSFTLGMVFAVLLTLVPIPLFAALMLLFVLAG